MTRAKSSRCVFDAHLYAAQRTTDARWSIRKNSDRTQLYKLEAAQKGTSVDQVALGYYLARLEHVNKGTWVDQFNKSSGSWEWFQWNR
jgi:hypothetical protein